MITMGEVIAFLIGGIIAYIGVISWNACHEDLVKEILEDVEQLTDKEVDQLTFYLMAESQERKREDVNS